MTTAPVYAKKSSEKTANAAPGVKIGAAAVRAVGLPPADFSNTFD
jgi:hypothetical protein